MKTIPLFGTGIKTLSDIITRQRRINVYYHIREDQDRATIVLLGTPGSVYSGTLPESPIRGWRVVNNTVYIVAGFGLYAIVPTTGLIKLGTLSVVSRYVSMTDNSIQLLIATGGFGYVYTLASSTLTKITDSWYPYGATSVDFLNQRFIAAKPNTREFYVSAILDGFTWNVLTLPIYGTKENNSDFLSCVFVLNGNLILFGTQTIEFWQDVGTTPQPFQRVNGATQQWGLAAVQSKAFVGNTMMFLGSNLNNALQVIKLNGYTPVRVSTSDIEDIISGFTTYDDAVALTYMTEGHIMYQLTFPTENRSFLYDDNTNVWFEVQTGMAETARHYAQLGISFNTKNFFCDETSGDIYYFDKDTYTDNGQVIKRQVATRHIRNQGNVLSIAELFLDFETGVGLNGYASQEIIYLLCEDASYLVTESSEKILVENLVTQGSDPQVMLRISRDGGHTFGNERWVNLGPLGTFLSRVILRRLGSARDFVVEITVTDPVKFVLASGSAVVESIDD